MTAGNDRRKKSKPINVKIDALIGRDNSLQRKKNLAWFT